MKKEKEVRWRCDCPIFLTPVLLVANCDHNFVTKVMSEEMEEDADASDISEWGGGVFWWTGESQKKTAFLVWIRENDFQTISHEVDHLVDLILDIRGEKHQPSAEFPVYYRDYWRRLFLSTLNPSVYNVVYPNQPPPYVTPNNS